MNYCDSIEWFVDMLGTLELLSAVTDAPTFITRRRVLPGAEAGLYFRLGHWYASDGTNVSDSYKEDYQRKGTAHFCQTFAAMIYLKEGGLVAHAYKDNIETAMAFWIHLFNTQGPICNWFLQEIKKSKWAENEVNIDDLVGMPNVKLRNFTKAMLITYIETVQKSASHLTGCMQG